MTGARSWGGSRVIMRADLELISVVHMANVFFCIAWVTKRIAGYCYTLVFIYITAPTI